MKDSQNELDEYYVVLDPLMSSTIACCYNLILKSCHNVFQAVDLQTDTIKNHHCIVEYDNRGLAKHT